MARLTVQDTATALAKLEGPDPYSRTQDYEGRRIEKADGGWIVLNHGKYRDRERVERRREYQAEHIRNKRRMASESELTGVNKVSTDVNKVSTGVNRSVSVSAYGSESASVRTVFHPPSYQEVEIYAASIGYALDGQAWCDSYAAKGWMVGKAKMKNWQAAVRNWKRNAWTIGQAKPTTTRPPLLTDAERLAICEARGG
jgi:hypothetical protein